MNTFVYVFSSSDVMALVESLQRAIDFIEEHLLENITIEDIAKQANISPFHFQRTFMILTDTSVIEYLRRRRLTLAAQELTSSSSKIIDLAYKYGYDTPESFSKAFRKQHGITPSEARKGNGIIQAYNRLTIQVNLKGAEPMNYKIIERDAFQIIGKKEIIPCGNKDSTGVIPNLWSKANSDGTIASLSQLNNGKIKGVLGITENYQVAENIMDYWIAAEYNGDVPNGFSSLTIPTSKWAVFEVQGPIPEAIVSTWRQIFSEWVPSNRYELADIASLEVYVGDYPNPTCEIWVPLK